MYRCGLLPAGGHGPPYPGAPRSVRVSSVPTGNIAAFLLAPFGNFEEVAGILTTTQCQNPDPVGAAGSNIVSTKLFAPAGGFVHESSGETLPPLHPNVFSTTLRGRSAVSVSRRSYRTDTCCSYKTSPAVSVTSTRHCSPLFTVCRL